MTGTIIINMKRIVIFLAFLLKFAQSAVRSIIGDSHASSVVPGTYMVEFETEMFDDGQELLFHHLVHVHGYKKENLLFRTRTKSALFHGYSFQLHGHVDENHILSIPNAKKIMRVS